MNTPGLRPYQTIAVADFRGAVDDGYRRIMLVAPTGSGKTIIGGDHQNWASLTQSVLVLHIGARSSFKPAGS